MYRKNCIRIIGEIALENLDNNLKESLERIKKGIIGVFKEFNICENQEQVAILNYYISKNIKEAKKRYRNTKKFENLKFDNLYTHLIEISHCGKEKQTALLSYLFWIGYDSTDFNNVFDIFSSSSEISEYSDIVDVTNKVESILDNTFIPFSLQEEYNKIDQLKLKSIRESMLYFLKESNYLKIDEILEDLFKNPEFIKLLSDRFNDVEEYLDSKDLFKQTKSFSKLDYKNKSKTILNNSLNYLFDKSQYMIDIGFEINEYDFLGFVYLVYYAGSFLKDIHRYCYSVLNSTNQLVSEYDLEAFQKLEKKYKKDNTTILNTRLEIDINTANSDYVEFSNQGKGELFEIIDLFKDGSKHTGNLENDGVETITVDMGDFE